MWCFLRVSRQVLSLAPARGNFSGLVLRILLEHLRLKCSAILGEQILVSSFLCSLPFFLLIGEHFLYLFPGSLGSEGYRG